MGAKVKVFGQATASAILGGWGPGARLAKTEGERREFARLQDKEKMARREQLKASASPRLRNTILASHMREVPV